jgi:NitT/TauT family transport system ATP-binding protein
MQVTVAGVSLIRPAQDGSVNHTLREVDLVVSEGSVHAIVGPNGCGKTSLLRVIAGLEEPSSGTISFTGTRRRENQVAFIFQDPTLLPWWNVERNVGIGAEFSGKPRAWYQRVTRFHTEQFGLSEFRHRAPRALSRGMQTKASIARAFAHDADVVLLDEPFVHLDAISRRLMQEELETHWQLEPRTFILVTHDVEEAVLLADRVSVMSPAPGRMVDTITVDLARPRSGRQAEPGFRAAIGHVWEALGRGGAMS